MAEHSPTPWRLQIDEVGPEFTDVPIVDANGEPVVITDSGCYPPDNATAALIVEAVNERDRLRDLVRRLVSDWERFVDDGPLSYPDERQRAATIREAREALGEAQP